VEAIRESRVVTLLGLAVIAVGLTPVITEGTAMAFPQPALAAPYEGCPPWIDIDYEFDSGSNAAEAWDTDSRNLVLDAAEQWETVLNDTQSQVVSIKKVPNTGWDEWADIDAYLYDPLIILGQEVNGLGLCDPDEIDDTETTTAGVLLLDSGNADSVIEDVSAHEMGHVLGTSHTGDEDSFDNGGGLVPIMATCQGVGDTDREFSQDDYQQLLHKATTARHASANRGFEEAGTTPAFWGKSGGSWSLVTNSSGAKAGDRYLEWTPASSSSYVYQTTNYAAGAWTKADAIVSFRVVTSGTGKVKAEVVRRDVDYPDNDGPCEDVFWATGQDQRTREAVGSLWVTLAPISEFTATTSWRTNSLTDSTVGANHDAYDLRVRVYSTVTSGGSMSKMALDNISIREVTP